MRFLFTVNNMWSLCLLPAWLPLLLLVSKCNGMDFPERATNYLFGCPPELLDPNVYHAATPQNGFPPPGGGLRSSDRLPQASSGCQEFRCPHNPAGPCAPPPSWVPFSAQGSPSPVYQSFHVSCHLHDDTDSPTCRGNGDEACDSSPSGLPTSSLPTGSFPSLAHRRSPENNEVVVELHATRVDRTSLTVSPHPSPQSELTRFFDDRTLLNDDDEAMAKAISESMKVTHDDENLIKGLSESMLAHSNQESLERAIEDSRRLKFDEDMAKARQASMEGRPDDKELLHAISESKRAHSNDECLRMAIENSKKSIFDDELRRGMDNSIKGERDGNSKSSTEDAVDFLTEEERIRFAIENSKKELAEKDLRDALEKSKQEVMNSSISQETSSSSKLPSSKAENQEFPVTRSEVQKKRTKLDLSEIEKSYEKHIRKNEYFTQSELEDLQKHEIIEILLGIQKRNFENKDRGNNREK